MNYTKLLYKLSLSLIFILSLFFTNIQVKAATSDLSGWGWSSNIGWVSFNCTNLATCATSQYKVSVDTNSGALSGYAWSSNIGWIKFSGDTSHSNPLINLSSGAVSGWIRACAGTVNGDCNSSDRTDGWNGWISLSGPNFSSPLPDGSGGITYIPSTGLFSGYAWGSVNVGWLSFGTASWANLVPKVTLSANPNFVTSGSDSTLTWTVSGPAATSCTASMTNGTSWIGPKDFTVGAHTEVQSKLTAPFPKIYSIVCSNAFGSSIPAIAKVDVIAPSPSPTPTGGPSNSLVLSLTPISGDTCTSPQTQPQIKLNWNSYYGATGYQIYRSTNGLNGPYNPYQLVSAPTVTFTDNSVTPGTKYAYKVSAVSGAGVLYISNIVSISGPSINSSCSGTPDVRMWISPLNPTDSDSRDAYTITVKEGKDVIIKWEETVGNTVDYSSCVGRITNNGSTQVTFRDDPNSNQYLMHNLLSGIYYYKMSCDNKLGTTHITGRVYDKNGNPISPTIDTLTIIVKSSKINEQ